MTTTAPPQSGVFPNARRRASSTPPPSSSMPGVAAPPAPLPSIEALEADPLRSASPPGQTLLHLCLPGQNTAEFATAVQVLAGALLTPRKARWFRHPPPAAEEIAALELVGEPQRVTFGLRGPDPLVQRLFAQLVAGYRQVEPVRDDDTPGETDPLVLHPGEAASWTELHLAKSAAIPCATPDPRNPRAFAQGADPLRGILETLAATPAPLRAVAQLVVRPAPAGWEQANRRQMQRLEQQRRHALAARPETGNEWSLLGLLLLLFGGLLTLWLAMQGLLGLAVLLLKLAAPLALLGGIGGAVLLGRRAALRQQWVGNEPLIADKLSSSVVQTCLRLYVLGPASAKPLREQTLSNLAELYASVTAGANRFVPTRTRQIGPIRLGSGLEEEPHRAMRVLPLLFAPTSRWPRLLLWWGGDRSRPVLGLREAATLWHLPQTAEDTPYLTVQTSRKQLPAPARFLISTSQLPDVPAQDRINPWLWSPEQRDKLGGLWGGITSASGKHYPLRFPTSMLDGHVGIVAATGAGKSALLKQLVLWAAADPQAAIFVLDPHSTLERDLRGMVPATMIADQRVVILDPKDAWPVGFHSLWDPEAARDRQLQEEIVSNIVATMERLSDGAWGQRVKANFIAGMTTLMRACAADWDAGRPVKYHTLLDLYPLFINRHFRDEVRQRLALHPLDFTVQAVWTYQHGVPRPDQALADVQSVLNRVGPLLLGPGQYLLGQRPAKFSLRQAIQEHKLCLVSLGGLGQENRRNLGSLFLSYLQGILLEQQWTHAAHPPRVYVVIDELQAFDPNTLMGLFAEVRKFGGRVIVGTSSLASIQHHSPDLYREMETNIGTWLVGRTGMNDARLVLERIQGNLEQPFTLRDVLRLSNHHFLAGTLVAGDPQPPFTFETLPPLPSDPTLGDLALTASRKAYGKHHTVAEQEAHAPAWQFEVQRLLDEQEQRRQQEQPRKPQGGGKQDQATGGKHGKNTKQTKEQPRKPDPEPAQSAAQATVRGNARVVEEEEEDVAAEAEAEAAAQGPPPKPGTRAAAFGVSPKHPRSTSAERQAATSGHAAREEASR